jgi:hypothetical protein
MRKMAVIIYAAILACWAGGALAQVDTVWSVRNGYGYFNCDINNDGYVYVAGVSYLSKYSIDNGGLVWARPYTPPGDVEYRDCNVNSIGSIYTCGKNGLTNNDAVYAKYNTNGDSIWIKLFNGATNKQDAANACVSDSIGNLYFVGRSDDASDLNDVLVVKCDTNGNNLWTRYYKGPAGLDDEGNGCCVDDFGNLYVVGYASDGSGTYRSVIIKYNTATGDSIWSKEYKLTGSTIDMAYACVLLDEYLFVVGKTYVSGGNSDILLLKVNITTGDTIFTKYFDISGNSDEATACAVNNNGHLFIAGYWSNGAEISACLLRIEPTNGSIIWQKKYGESNGYADYFFGCAVDNSNGIYTVGYSNDGLGSRIIKYIQTLIAPTLIVPAHETFTNNLSPNFYWHEITDTAAWYKLQVSSDPGFATLWHDGLGPDTTQQAGLIGGRWYWRVRAYSGGDSSDWSEVRALTVDTAYPYNPVLKGPPDNAWVNGGPALSWNWVQGLMFCHVQVSPDTNFIFVADSAVVADSFYYLPAMPDGKYFWRVQSCDSAGNWSTFSEVRRYRLDATPPTITWTSPVNGATNVMLNDTVKIIFSEPLVPGSFMYEFSPTVAMVYGGGSATHDTMLLWSDWFQTGTEYTLTVTSAQDSAGNVLTGGPVPNPWSFTMSTDGVGPVIIHTPSGAALNPGADAVIEATIVDSLSGVDLNSVHLLYREGGAANYDSVAMSFQGGELYRGTIPGASIGQRGLSYFIRAADVLSARTVSPAGAPDLRHQRTVAVGTVAMPSALPAGAYRMFSAPFLSGGSPWRPYELVDDFGTYDDTVWRLFRWQSGAYAEFNAVEDIVPGRAYWVIAKNGGSLDLASAVTPPDSACYIPLAQGWNMVGAPFAYPVYLTNAQVFDGGGNNYGFLDTANALTEQRLVAYAGGGYSNSDQFQPWQGYWIKSLVPSATLLVQAAAAAKSAPAKAAPEGWLMSMSAVINGCHDRDNAAGITPRGSRGNVSEPPALDGYVSLSFQNQGRRLAEDYRESIGDGQGWRFAVSTDQAGNMDLSFAEQGSNGGWSYALYDITAGQKVTSAGSYDYQSPQGGGTREFALLAGSPEFIESEAGRAGLLPGAVIMERCYPNPFSARTTISYMLPGPVQVNLSVYNILGQKVRSLFRGRQPAGRYQVVWDGRNNANAAVPGGIYFVRLQAGREETVNKIMLVK